MTAQPIPATALVWPQGLALPMPRFLLLAVLLHVWLVLMLGNAPGGTALQGQGVYGRLNITLQGAPVGPAGMPAPPQLPATPTGALGDAEAQRFGGALRSALPHAALPPGAAQLGDWSPVRGERPNAEPAAAAPEPAPQSPPAADLAAPPPPPAATAPTTFGSTPLQGLQRSLLPLTPSDSALPRVAPAPVAALPAVPAPEAGVVAAPLKQLSVAPLTLAPPEAALRALPSTMASDRATWTAVPLPAVPLTSAPLAAASAEKQLSSRLLAERSTTGAALAEVGRASAAPLLAAVPAAAGDALPSPAPVPTGAQASAPQPALPAAAAATAAAAAAVAATPLQGAPKLSARLPQAASGSGAPDAGSRVGIDVATLPSTPASAPKRLNLDLPRLRGGELSRYSTTGLLPALPRPPEVPDKLGNAIEKTAKEDCRKAYAGAGLLAVVPLAVDAVREGGCKW